MKSLISHLCIVLIFCHFSPQLSLAQSFTTQLDPPVVPTEIVLPDAVCGNTTITQSTSQTITSLNSVACPGGDDSYFRAFDLGTFGITNDFDICEVQIGVERVTSGGTAPITVNLYTSNPAFPGGALTLIGTTVAQLSNQALTIVTIPVTGTAPAGSELVVEVFAPDFSSGFTFFIGSNASGQTGPSYLQTAICGAPAPLTTAALGFPNMHIVMNVIGNEQGANNISLAPDTATNNIGTEHTVTATVDDDGIPEEDVLVTFEVMAGPNMGKMSIPDNGECSQNDDCTTDVNGQVSWTYTGVKNPGTDTIVASFTSSGGGIILSNFVQKTWVVLPIPTLSDWGLIALAGILGIVGFIAIRRRYKTA